MKFSSSKDNILKSAMYVEGAVSAKSTIQLLSNILIEAENDMVRFSATDLELAILTEFPAEIETPGAITVHAKKFIDFLRAFKGGDIQLELDEHNVLHMSSTTPKTKTNYQMQGISKDDFPEITRFDPDSAIRFPMEMLKRMITKTIFSVSTDDARYFLQGLYFERGSGNRINVVATDGRRLAFLSDEVEDLNDDIELNVIVPKKILMELTKVLQAEGQCEAALSENKIYFKVGNTQLSSNLLEGKYPDYRQIIPKSYETKVVINTVLFQQAVENVSKILDTKSNRLSLQIEPGTVRLSGQHPDFGNAHDEVIAEYTGTEPLTIAFNNLFVLDSIREIETDEMQIELRGHDKATVFRGIEEENYFSMIMPMNIKQEESASQDEESSESDENTSEDVD